MAINNSTLGKALSMAAANATKQGLSTSQVASKLQKSYGSSSAGSKTDATYNKLGEYAAGAPVETIDYSKLSATIASQYDKNAPFDASQIAGKDNIPFQSTQSNLADANAFVASVGQTQGIQTAYDQEVAQREADLAKEQSKLSKLADSFNLTKQYDKLQKQSGIPDITKQLQQANLQLSQMQSQYQMTNQELAQQTVPQPFVIGQQNELAKTAAIQIGAQASYVQALQGNLDLANHYVDKMIDMQAKDFEVKYNAQKYNLELAFGFLDRADAKQAKAIDFQLDLQKADYADMLETKRASMQNALLNGAPQSVISEIASATTSAEVYSAAGRYAKDAVAASQLYTDSLQQQKLRQDISGGGESKQTATQVTAESFANRLIQANGIINPLGGDFTGKFDALCRRASRGQVVRFRHLPPLAAPLRANVGIKGPLARY